jgi:hypothetical protein
LRKAGATNKTSVLDDGEDSKAHQRTWNQQLAEKRTQNPDPHRLTLAVQMQPALLQFAKPLTTKENYAGPKRNNTVSSQNSSAHKCGLSL